MLGEELHTKQTAEMNMESSISVTFKTHHVVIIAVFLLLVSAIWRKPSPSKTR